MSYDRANVLGVLVDLSAVQDAAKRLGVSPAEVAERIEPQLSRVWVAFRDAPSAAEGPYQIVYAVKKAAEALT